MTDQILTVHISKERYERIRAQGYKLLEYPSDKWNSIVARLGGGDTLYHLLDGDDGQCEECGRLRTSVKVETPAELETVKYHLRHGPFPTITMDRAGSDLDLGALDWLNHQIRLTRVLGDYVCVNVNLQRLPVEYHCGGYQVSSVAMPDAPT